jgi:hypothetical protein
MYQEALNKVQQAEIAGYRNPLTKSLTATLYLQLGNAKEAIKIFNELLLDKNLVNFGITESDVLCNLGLAFYSDSNCQEAINQYIKAIESNCYNNSTGNNIIILNGLAYILLKLGDFSSALQVYDILLSYKDKPIIDIQSLKNIAISKADVEIQDISYNEQEDIQCLSKELGSCQEIETLIIEYIQTDLLEVKKNRKAQILEIISENAGLEKYIKNHFDINSIGDIFITDRPQLIHKFFEHKKDIAKKLLDDKSNSQKVSHVSNNIDGYHQIKTNDTFKGKWFFKFTKKIMEESSICWKKTESKINELKIYSETSKGRLGFKKHEVKIDKGVKFPMIKLVGLEQDNEICSKTIYKYYDDINGVCILSILDTLINHKESNSYINQGEDQKGDFKQVICGSYQEFENILSGDHVVE